MTIATKHGYFSITNGYVTWSFYEQAATSACQAYADHELDKLDILSILKTNNATNMMISSNWPHVVTNSFSLVDQIKRDRLEKERGKF